MDKMELISFKIISAVGTAKSMYVEAFKQLKKATLKRLIA